MDGIFTIADIVDRLTTIAKKVRMKDQAAADELCETAEMLRRAFNPGVEDRETVSTAPSP